MRIAAAGKSNIGIPGKVGKDFVKADKAKGKKALSKLPLRRGAPPSKGDDDAE